MRVASAFQAIRSPSPGARRGDIRAPGATTRGRSTAASETRRPSAGCREIPAPTSCPRGTRLSTGRVNLDQGTSGLGLPLKHALTHTVQTVTRPSRRQVTSEEHARWKRRGHQPARDDPALLRAGRFDRQVLVDCPDRKGRLEILNVHIRRTRGRAAAASLPPHAGIVGVRTRARLLLARPQCLARSPRIGAAGRRTNRPYSEDIGLRYVLTIISTATSVATHASSRGAT